MPSSEPNQPRDEAVARMLTAAAVHQRRGDAAAAWRALDDALAVDPHSAVVLTRMGQLNLEAEEFEPALACFQRALAVAPGLKDAELGLAEATLEIKRREPLSPEELLATGGKLPAPPHNASLAATFSALLPGLGHMRLLEFGRGWLFLGVAFVCWAMVVFGVRSPGPLRLRLTPLFWLGGLLTLAWHTYAAVDAYNLAQDLNAEEQRRL